MCDVAKLILMYIKESWLLCSVEHSYNIIVHAFLTILSLCLVSTARSRKAFMQMEHRFLLLSFFAVRINLSMNWTPANIHEDWMFSCNSHGWTSNIHAFEWLIRCFEPATHDKAMLRGVLEQLKM